MFFGKKKSLGEEHLALNKCYKKLAINIYDHYYYY